MQPERDLTQFKIEQGEEARGDIWAGNNSPQSLGGGGRKGDHGGQRVVYGEEKAIGGWGCDHSPGWETSAGPAIWRQWLCFLPCLRVAKSRAPFFSSRSFLVLPLPGCTRLFPRTVSSPSRTASFLLAFCLVVYVVMSMYNPVAAGFTSVSLAWCQTSSDCRCKSMQRTSSHSHALPRLPQKHVVAFEQGLRNRRPTRRS